MTFAVKVADLDDLADRTTITTPTDLELVGRGNDAPTGNLIAVQNDHAQLGALTAGRVVLLEENDEITGSFVIEAEHDDHVVPPNQGGAGNQVTTKTGRPLVSILDRAAVGPTLGYGRKPWADTRVFSFASREFDASAWDFATAIVEHQADESEFYTGLPGGWFNPDATWIGPSVGDEHQGYVGHWYTVGDFTLAEDTVLFIVAAADNAAPQIYFDGFALTSFGTEVGFTDTHRATIFASAGPHRIAAKISNYVDGGTEPGPGLGDLIDGNPTALLLSCFSVDSSGRLGPLIIQTDTAWRILEYPDDPPGMAITQVAGILLDEAQTDGLLPGVTWDFTDTDFSDETTAPILESVTVNVGDSLLVCFKNWSLAYCDFSMPPDEQLLSMFPYQAGGVASGVEYSVPNGNLASLSYDTVDVGTDCLIVFWNGAPFRYPSTGGNRLGFLRTRAATYVEAQTLAAQTIARQQAEIEQVTLAITPVDDDDTPGLGVNIFDTVTVPARPSGTSDERVMEIRKKLTNRGIESSIAVRDVHLSDLDRVDLVIQRMLSGSLGGTAPSAPADPPPLFGSKINTSEVTFSSPDPVVVGEATKDKVPSQSGNLYAVAITAKTAGSTDTELEFLVDGNDVLGGNGILPATELFVLIPVDYDGLHTTWVEGNKSRLTVNITTAGTDVAGLLIEPRFL